MSNTLIYKYKDIRKEILEAVDLIADPVVSTLSPKGANVIFEDVNGNLSVTKDGVTVARSINVKDPIKNAIINILKHSSMKTNSEAGDATTTSMLFSQILIKEGFKLIDEGWNEIDLKRELDKLGEEIVAKLKEKAVKIKDNKELFNVANISANNDKEVTKNVIEIIDFAGLDGMVFIEPNNKVTTEIEKEPGFFINAGMQSPEFRNSPTNFSCSFKEVPLLITDKRLYYAEEAEAILKTVLKSGFNSVVVVAKDFLGEALNVLVANHNKDVVKLLLVRDPSDTGDIDLCNDLAIYTNGKVTHDKNGGFVKNLKIEDFVMVHDVYSDAQKTIIRSKVSNKNIKELVSNLKKELEKDKDNSKIKQRISSLTNGTVTIKVGGSTPLEQREKIYRYEDAINASRAALRDGYLVGGGLSLYGLTIKNDKLGSLVDKLLTASVRKIAENSGKHVETVFSNTKGNVGYNASSNKFEDLLKVGVLDSYKAVEMSVLNSISVAGVILSSKNLIVVDREVEDKK